MMSYACMITPCFLMHEETRSYHTCITHHNRQSDSTFLIEFGQGRALRNVESD